MSLLLLLFGWAAAASAATASVSVDPDTSLVDGNSVTVTVTTTAATPNASVFIGVTQCGNATSSGSPIAALATDGSDCIGASGFGTTLQVIGAGGAASPTGPVAAGTYHVTLKLQEAGIGSANTKCTSMPPATIPCQIVAATATLTGSYTGDGSFTANAAITYANNASTTTTSTTRPATTSTTVAASSGGGSGTSQSVSATVGSSPSSQTGSSAAESASAGSSASATQSSLAASTGTGASSALANTGPPGYIWPLGIGGLVLLDLGYLTASATWKARRRSA